MIYTTPTGKQKTHPLLQLPDIGIAELHGVVMVLETNRTTLGHTGELGE